MGDHAVAWSTPSPLTGEVWGGGLRTKVCEGVSRLVQAGALDLAGGVGHAQRPSGYSRG